MAHLIVSDSSTVICGVPWVASGVAVSECASVWASRAANPFTRHAYVRFMLAPTVRPLMARKDPKSSGDMLATNVLGVSDIWAGAQDPVVVGRHTAYALGNEGALDNHVITTATSTHLPTPRPSWSTTKLLCP